VPASRGRIVDRNGLLLATSVPTPSIWAIPKDVRGRRREARELARLLGMTPSELEHALTTTPTSCGCKRQVDDTVARR
jgi:cell division protein FtsI (penicillin-binding protein 3)